MMYALSESGENAAALAAVILSGVSENEPPLPAFTT